MALYPTTPKPSVGSSYRISGIVGRRVTFDGRNILVRNAPKLRIIDLEYKALTEDECDIILNFYNDNASNSFDFQDITDGNSIKTAWFYSEPEVKYIAPNIVTLSVSIQVIDE